MKKELTIKQKLERFRKGVNKLAELQGQLGFIPLRDAAWIRGTSRSAITQLITRGRLDAVYINDSPFLVAEQVKNYAKEKPGPKVEL